MIFEFVASGVPKGSTFIPSSDKKTLDVKVLAVVPGTEIPVRGKDGNVLATFVATEELIKKAVDEFNGDGVFNVDHVDNTKIGTFSAASYEDGFVAIGKIECPTWIERISTDNYSGLSIQGPAEGDWKNPSKITINKISFLSPEATPQGGACPKTECDIIAAAARVPEDDEDDSDAEMEAAWAPNYDAIWAFVEVDGKINQSRAKKVFLLKRDGSTGENREDWAYPVATIVNGKPKDNWDGLMAAYKRAKQQGENGILGAIRTRMRKFPGKDLPPGLQAKAEASAVREGNDFKIISRSIDPINGDILDEKVFVFTANKEADIMAEEVKNVVATPAAEVVTPAASVVTPVPVVTQVLEAATLVESDPWITIKAELGVSSKKEFDDIVAAANEAKNLKPLVESQKTRLGTLEKFYKDSQMKMIKDNFPPAVWDGKLEQVTDEYLADPAIFNATHLADAIKFAASKAETAEMKGAAVESAEVQAAKAEMDEKAAKAKKVLNS